MKTALLVILAPLCLPEHARADAVDEAIHRIEAARSGVRTLSAEFTQDKIMTLFAETIRSEGRLFIERPDKLRWEIVRPDASVVLIRGATVQYRLAGSEGDVDLRSAGPLGVVMRDLLSFMAGPISRLRDRYRIGLAEGSAPETLALDAAPLAPELRRSIIRLRLQFTADGRRLTAVMIEEPGGDRSEIRLRNVQINRRLPRSVFSLRR